VRRTLLLSLVVYGLTILGLASRQREVLVLALPFLLYLGAGFFYGPRTINLTVRRTLSADRVPHGQSVAVKLLVTNAGPSLENVLITDLVPPGLEVVEGEAAVLTPLWPGGTVELNYRLMGKRGYYQFVGVQATATDLFGLFRKHVTWRLFNQLFILPEVVKLPNIAVQPRRTRVFPGLNRARKGGAGVEFFGVREYQAGDSLRWINSRASARQEQALFVNEFEQERAIDVGLIMDARQKTNLKINGASLFEYTIQATTTLMDTFLSQGNRVSLFIYGGYLDWTFPGSGKIQRERILQTLARAELQDSLVFQKLEHLPTRLFPARSQLVFISPLRLDDLSELVKLRAHGYPLLVVSPNPISFEEKVLGPSPQTELAARIARLERQRLFQKLAQMGVRLFEWQVDTPFYEAAQVALNRPLIWTRGPAP